MCDRAVSHAGATARALCSVLALFSPAARTDNAEGGSSGLGGRSLLCTRAFAFTCVVACRPIAAPHLPALAAAAGGWLPLCGTLLLVSLPFLPQIQGRRQLALLVFVVSGLSVAGAIAAATIASVVWLAVAAAGALRVASRALLDCEVAAWAILGNLLPAGTAAALYAGIDFLPLCLWAVLALFSLCLSGESCRCVISAYAGLLRLLRLQRPPIPRLSSSLCPLFSAAAASFSLFMPPPSAILLRPVPPVSVKSK